jgi:ABC-type branched-subunit amino acid transport system substrate-binding protein
MHSRSRFRWLVAALIVLIAATAFGCKSKKSTPSTSTPGAGSPTSSAPLPTVTPYTGKIVSPTDILKKDGSATKQATIDWGFMFELSGPPEVQGFGVPTSQGAKMAVQEINDAGGFQVGDTVYKINIINEDTRSDPGNTQAIAQELVQDKKVKVIFGPATLGETEATQITQAAQVIHLCPCQEREHNALSSVEKAHGDDRWAFQTLLPYSLLIGQAAKSFHTEYPTFHTMALICQDSPTGHDICEHTKDAYAAEGVQIIGSIQYFPVGTTDYNPFLTNIKSAGQVDYLYNYDDPESTPTIVRQAIQLGVGKLQLVTIPANLVSAFIPDIPSDVIISAGAAPRQEVKPTSTKAADYFNRLRAFEGIAPGGNLPPASFVSLMTYDYVYMVAGAMQQASTVDDTTKIAKALEIEHYNGVAEDDLFFNTRHLAVHGTEPCTVTPNPAGGDPTISCVHTAPPPEAYR